MKFLICKKLNGFLGVLACREAAHYKFYVKVLEYRVSEVYGLKCGAWKQERQIRLYSYFMLSGRSPGKHVCWRNGIVHNGFAKIQEDIFQARTITKLHRLRCSYRGMLYVSSPIVVHQNRFFSWSKLGWKISLIFQVIAFSVACMSQGYLMMQLDVWWDAQLLLLIFVYFS